MNKISFALYACGVVLSAASFSGCGVKRVPDTIIAKLPYEARIELLEAENDLAVAVDRLDESRNEVVRTKDLIRRAKDRLGSAKSEVGAASDQVSKDVAELAVTEGEARLEYLRAKQDVNREEEKLAEVFLTCAMSKFEQSRLAAARKAKVEGSEALSPEDFEEQVKSCDTKYTERRAAAKEVAARAETVKGTWESAKASLAKKTFDARASPFVE